MTSATDLTAARSATRRQEIADSLRAQWRMIATVSLRPSPTGDGYEAAVRLDPIVVKASLEQQGYPTNPAALARLESRRLAAVEECVRQVNAGLEASERISRVIVEA